MRVEVADINNQLFPSTLYSLYYECFDIIYAILKKTLAYTGGALFLYAKGRVSLLICIEIALTLYSMCHEC